MNSLSERISILLAYNHMTKQNLADATDISYKTLCHYIKGTRIPSVKDLIAIADAFNVSVDFIIGRSGSVEIKDTMRYKQEIDFCNSAEGAKISTQEVSDV